MRLCAVTALILAICCSFSYSREITHEDIKDAMLSLVHMMRENTEKLERHEVRERQLGEQMKKAIGLLSKRISSVDALKSHLNKLDEKIDGIEQSILQRDERERIQIQKTTDTLENLENRLDGWLSGIKAQLSEVHSRPVPMMQPPSQNDKTSDMIIAKLNKTETSISGQVARLEFDLDSISVKLKDDSASQRDKIQVVSDEINKIGARLGDIEDSLRVFNEANKRSREIPEKVIPDPRPAIEEQNRMLKNLKELLEDTTDRIHQIPIANELKSLHNESQSALQEAKHFIEDIVTRGIVSIEDKVMQSKDETKDTVSELRLDLSNNAERVNQELHGLEKGQSVMVSMADHVLDTKKRVEYGVHQILLEVGDLVKAQGNNINETLNLRFDGISNDIMDNQNGAVANLTTKMEQEMNQVWRQINVMYQQMTESAKALDKLHKQNEAYVNGTTSTMGGMESKVGEITKRMSEVDENLNFLLGRLSLVTQEFNQIKSGLGAALDNIRESFKEVQEKANGFSNPGPHPVPENYRELEAAQPKSKPNMEGKTAPELMKDIKSY
ncbi:kinesin-related protein 9 [Venturia canescens]|uniref:kinesin-related protein 9 n=1 Tax=Venturia canescens TaxID=32260 RepID=UPI001C9CBEBE|nr:kinesin-related protein 9 [Venturia canescens]XP_043277574.1 kinesin-related protein 9 [Venturia canescens]XP_043277575.1 kinesin-related protein 9 [Venturia canescens]